MKGVIVQRQAERSIGLLVTPAARQDGLRVRSVLATRKSRSQQFFAETAATWDDVRRDMFGDLGASGALVRALKQHFDPTGVLNPGRFAGHN